MNPTYWFMRMRQGRGGEDFTRELWEQRLAGVMFGTWPIHLVLDGNGEVDKDKLDAGYIEKNHPQPDIGFTNSFLNRPRAFLCDVFEGDRLIVEYGHTLHIGIVGQGYRDDPDGSEASRGGHGERFKCRPVEGCKSFGLAELPASYRLLTSTGRSAIQRIKEYRVLVEILDKSEDTDDVKRRLLQMPDAEFLTMLSPKQWEVLCAEYLRSRYGFRPLLLAIGDTLKTVDIYGINEDGERILAQCKNGTARIDAKVVEEWEIQHLARREEDRLFFFCRGGLKHGRQEVTQRTTVVTAEDILGWLAENPAYSENLRTS